METGRHGDEPRKGPRVGLVAVLIGMKARARLGWIMLINVQRVEGTRELTRGCYLCAVCKLQHEGNVQHRHSIRNLLIRAAGLQQRARGAAAAPSRIPFLLTSSACLLSPKAAYCP